MRSVSRPLLIFVCATVRGSQAANAILPAVQNLLLAGRSLGIGGTITTLHPTVEDQVHELFEIPETAQIVYCMPFGYPRGNFGPVSRRPPRRGQLTGHLGALIPGAIRHSPVAVTTAAAAASVNETTLAAVRT